MVELTSCVYTEHALITLGSMSIEYSRSQLPHIVTTYWVLNSSEENYILEERSKLTEWTSNLGNTLLTFIFIFIYASQQVYEPRAGSLEIDDQFATFV